jgi:hypothetical protein
MLTTILQFSYFSAIDGFLLEWLPFIVGLSLAIWFWAELNNTPPASETEELIEPPKPFPAKEIAKPSRKRDSVAALIADEYQKRSRPSSKL